jgi:transposase
VETGRRHELTGAAWAVIERLLPRTQCRRGRPWRDHRIIVNGILWVLAAGVPWRDAPEHYGPWQTLYGRFARWTDDGTWSRIHQALLAEAHRQGKIDRSLWCVDGTSIRALKAAAGARRTTRHTCGVMRRREPADHALGRSRGGWGSKLHVVCDRAGVVLGFRVTAGQVNECTEFVALLESIAIRRSAGPPSRRPSAVAGDKGYSTKAIRAWCRTHRVSAVIPERDDQREHRAHRPGRKLNFDRQQYRARNIVERVIGWLKNLRRIACRAEKLAVRYAGMVTLALIARTANGLSDIT